MSEIAFSQKLREELLQVLLRSPERWSLAFYAMGFAALRFQGRDMRLTTRYHDFALLLQTQIRQIYGIEARIKPGKGQTSLLLRDLRSNRLIREDLRLFGERGRQFPEEWEDEEERNQNIAAVLSALFLACGSLSDPKEAYHLDFSMLRQQAAKFYTDFFEKIGISMRSIRHQGYYVLYVKDGQNIADFLLYAGAHQALLNFEEWRVEKSVLNQVNRVVNCDNANAQRLADSSAKQREAILRLRQSSEYAELSEELKEACEARLQFPELSLAELGARMDPPIGKSGMNHRLKKVMSLCETLKKEGPGSSS